MTDKTNRCRGCGYYRVDSSDPEPDHPENMEWASDPDCPIHGEHTDPRWGALQHYLEEAGLHYQPVGEALSGIDAADRAAGIVRVDTRDEALEERLVGVAAESLRSGCPVPMCRGTHRADARLVVRAVLAAAAGGER